MYTVCIINMSALLLSGSFGQICVDTFKIVGEKRRGETCSYVCLVGRFTESGSKIKILFLTPVNKTCNGFSLKPRYVFVL